MSIADIHKTLSVEDPCQQNPLWICLNSGSISKYADLDDMCTLQLVNNSILTLMKILTWDFIAERLYLSNASFLSVKKHMNQLGNRISGWRQAEQKLQVKAAPRYPTIAVYLELLKAEATVDTIAQIKKQGDSNWELPEISINNCKEMIPFAQRWIKTVRSWGSGLFADRECLEIRGLHYLPIDETFKNMNTIICFADSKFKKLPPEVGQLDQHEYLEFLSCRLTELPPEIGRLTSNLRQLRLGENALDKLPPEFGNLTKLRELSLDSNLLTKFPEEIRLLTKLCILDLSFNSLENLPFWLPELKNLRYLSLMYNRSLKELHPSILEIKHVVIINLTACSISTLPEGIWESTQVSFIFSPREIKSLSHSKEFYRERIFKGESYLDEKKETLWGIIGPLPSNTIMLYNDFYDTLRDYHVYN